MGEGWLLFWLFVCWLCCWLYLLGGGLVGVGVGSSGTGWCGEEGDG